MTHRTPLLLLLGLTLTAIAIPTTHCAAADPPAAANWPTWRGPLSTGAAPSSSTPPLEWSETKNIQWRAKLPGPGHATPVVWGNRIYVLSVVRTDKTAEQSHLDNRNSQPPTLLASTATADAGAYAITTADTNAAADANPTLLAQNQQSPPPPHPPRTGGMPRPPKPTHIHQYIVTAIHRSTGKNIWQTIVREEVPHEPGHTTASQASASPVTDGKHVWAFFGSRGLFCLDMDGKVIWEQDFGDMETRNEFGEGSSPVVHGDTIVVNWDHEGRSFIVALDKLTGERRWKVPRNEPTSWATPLIVEDEEGRALVLVAATNRTRAYDVSNGREMWSFKGLGVNVIPTPVADDETLFVMSGYRDAAAMAVRYKGAYGDITEKTAHFPWKLEGGMSYVPSPLLYEGKVYFLERFKGMLSCYDLKTGKEYYTKQRLEGLGNIYASPVGAAGRVYVIDRDGNAVVFKHGEKFEVLAENKLDDAFDASPVVVGDELFLRGHDYLYKVAE